jgi:hypothetical protein
MTILYRRDLDPDHPFWASVPGSRSEGYPLLDALARGAGRVLAGAEEAERTLGFLEELGFNRWATGRERTPVAIEDFDGRPVIG